MVTLKKLKIGPDNIDKICGLFPQSDISVHPVNNLVDAIMALALAEANKRTELVPNSADAWYDKGNALGKLGRSEEALTAYDMAIKIKPNHTMAWYGRSNALNRLGRAWEAEVASARAELCEICDPESKV